MARFNEGCYEGQGRGYRGKVTVQVTLSAERIESVKVTEQNEIRGIGWGLNTSPVETLPGLIVEYQSLNIPEVEGAELTSKAILDGAAAAIKASGAGKELIAELKAAPGPVPPEATDEERTVDLLICGAGAAGLAAAIEAKLSGAEVLIVEKQGITGGSTARSGGKILGAGTKWQKRQGIYDSPDMVYDYLMEVGDRRGDFMSPVKTRYVADHLNSTLDWLSSIQYSIKGDPEEVLAQPWQELTRPGQNEDGSLKKGSYTVQDVEPIHVSLQPWRVHNSPGGGGQTNGEGGEISVPLTLYYENDLGGEIVYNTALSELLTDGSGAVTGAVCKKAAGGTLTVHARKGVILATGGYGRNKEMCARYPTAHYFSTAPHGNVGDGLVAAEKIGARNFVHPGVQVVYTSLTCGIGINDESGLIVNEKGDRVVNEWTYQYTVGDALAASGSNCGWYITSGKEPYPGVKLGYKMAVAGKSKDPVAGSIEGLARKMGCDPERLQKTFDRYCELVEKGVDEDFGKPAEFLHPIEGPKYAALRLHPCITVTFGGLEIDVSARVLRPDGSFIPGLFAAGEVAGTGFYGTEYPTCGTSICGAMMFGRAAARTALGLEKI